MARHVPPAPFLPCFLPSGHGKPFLCRSSINVLPSFLSAVPGMFCVFLPVCRGAALSAPIRKALPWKAVPRSARFDRGISQAMKSNLLRRNIYNYNI